MKDSTSKTNMYTNTVAAKKTLAFYFHCTEK